MVAEVVAKRKCALFFTPTPFDHVYVMTVGPSDRPMEERTTRVVRMRHVNVPYGLKGHTASGWSVAIET